MEKSERTGRISSSQLNRTVPSAARWQVRKAETYIEANWDQPSTIEALARVTEPSALALTEREGCWRWRIRWLR